MNSTIVEETATAPEAAAEEQPKATKKAARAPRRAAVAPAKGKARKKAKAVNNARKTPTAAKKAKGVVKPSGSREGSKTATILELLKRPGGATAKELMKATGWQPHSVRGFLSGTLRKKMGLEVVSTKGEDGQRTYSIKG
ncbi:MAG TPA: DUF3489 domain-containing protein [Bryobacteraceae bacterium]